jgi:hypothetical protein
MKNNIKILDNLKFIKKCIKKINLISIFKIKL